MADSYGPQTGRMRDTTNFITENGVDNFDTASQGSREDCFERDPGFMEDRFRVDRKKLEQMLQLVPGDEFLESAEDFFQRVMDETNTQITWPSKLKIGAKSKKDPHIKVIGFPDDVRAAKAKIMSILDTKSNRVTLKMDVSHTEHSHVIGKGGNNIKRVMMETGCHIHFPDSNRGNNVQEKSNQVSIAGQPAGVENARAQIRELLPLVFMFELQTAGLLQTLPDASSPMIQQLQQVYNVTVTFKQRPRMPVTTVIVRGSVINAKSVKEATGKLMETFTGSASHVVSMHLEIAPQHHLFIIGRQGCNVKSIMHSTNSNILFPDPDASAPQRRGTVVIRGTIESVFCARQHLIGCLPLVLMFDVKEDIELEQGRLSQLMEQLDVYISVKPKPKQPSKSVIVKSIERNARNMYLARLLLLGLHPEGLSGPLLKAASANSHNSAGLGLTTLGFLNSHSLLNVTTPSSLLLMNSQINGHHTPSLSSPPSPLAPTHNQYFHNSPSLFSPLMVVTPASNCSVPTSFDVMSQVNGYQKDFAANNPFIRLPTQQSQGPSSNNSDSASSPAHSPCSSPQSVVSFRHGTAVELGTLQPTGGNMENVITRDTSTLSSSGHTLDLLGLSKTTPLNQPPPVTATLFNGHRMQNGEKSPESSGAESDGSDKLAPGSERKNSSSSLFTTPLPFPFDYEQKKLLAMKAMQKKPEGESRIPTDAWAGMGFSKSMPESAIRDKLSQLGLNSSRFNECLPPPSELVEGGSPSELDLDIDRDPWKDSRNMPYLNRAPGEFPSLRRKFDYLSQQLEQQQQQHQQHQMVGDGGLQKPDLAELFSKLGLGKYTDLFQQQEIDLATFLTLTDQDLKELGITTFGARRKMLLAIADLNKGHTLLKQAHARPAPNPFHQSSNGHVPGHRRPEIASLSGRW